jgi:unsaturated rhamnogalacturonyl hydrolase
MGGLFLAQWGRLIGDARFTAESARQFERHYAYLHDPATGLIRHGYSGLEHRQIGVLWGRGNGWFAAASLAALPYLDAATPEHATIRANLRRHLDGVIRTQGASGAWHTVMDDPATLPETSCTAAFAYALGGTSAAGLAGLRDSLCRERALAWLQQCVTARGEVLKSSGGTPIMPTAAAYNAVPYAVTGFSQGLALLALSQTAADPAAPQ